MKVVFLLAIVLVIAAVVVNAEEEHKKKHERNHDHKEHKDGSHGKDRNKKEHKERNDRHIKKHEGKKDKHHKDRKHSEKHIKHVDRSINHEVHSREAEDSCPINKEACCLKNRCILTCADAKNIFRKLKCGYENWWNNLIQHILPGASKDKCTPEHENYKCACKNGFFLRENVDSCVTEEECSTEDKPEGEGDGTVGGGDVTDAGGDSTVGGGDGGDGGGFVTDGVGPGETEG